MPGIPLENLVRYEFFFRPEELAKIPLIIDKEVKTNPQFKALVYIKAMQAMNYWKSIAPVSERPAHPLQKGGQYMDEPGDYKKSIKVKFWHNAKGFGARVYSNDAKAHWIEWGSHPGGKNYQPEQACAARTVEHFSHGDHEELSHVLKELAD